MLRRLSWLVMAAVVVVALVVGTQTSGEHQTVEARVRSIAATVKCPQCRSQSAADSDTFAAEAIRDEIEQRLELGESADEIRGYFASRYGNDILLNPPSSGIAGLVWVLPVAGLVAALAGITVAFRRWRRWAT